jgi:hypothetical protein
VFKKRWEAHTCPPTTLNLATIANPSNMWRMREKSPPPLTSSAPDSQAGSAPLTGTSTSAACVIVPWRAPAAQTRGVAW